MVRLSPNTGFSTGKTLLPAEHGKPDAPSALSLTYAQKVAGLLKRVRAVQSENILESAYVIARTMEKGQQIWSCWYLAHINSADIFPGRNGKPEFINAGYDFGKVRDGDLMLANFPWPQGYIEELAKRDLFVIFSMHH